jgi:ATP-dependent helicase IRC3
MATRSYSCGTGNCSRVTELTQTFREAGVDARYVRSKVPAAERKLLVEGFKVGYPVLVKRGSFSLPHTTCVNLTSSNDSAILSEVADIPNVDSANVARPTRARNAMAQNVRSPRSTLHL